MFPTTRTALLVTRDRMNDELRRADNDRRRRTEPADGATATGEPATFATIRRWFRRGRTAEVWT
jgi:hypothetical protein